MSHVLNIAVMILSLKTKDDNFVLVIEYLWIKKRRD